jgi:serine/threonine protein kinase
MAAHKFTTYQSKNFETEFKREAKILKNLNHPHIIKMIKNSVDEEKEGTGIHGGIEKRPNSGGINCTNGKESRRSGKGDSSSNSSGSEDTDSVTANHFKNSDGFSKYILLEYAENGDLFDYVISP